MGFFESERPLWTVSELTRSIKSVLEGEFPSVRVEGEVSNCRPSAAGHIYFTLKDTNAVIAAALFRGRASGIEVRPVDGLKVIVEGKIDVYAPRGSYQLIVSNLKPAGRGALLEELERRKKMLASEGLFNQERKRALPPYPRHIAIITSPTGAAVRDILRVLSRRSAAPRITILPTPVQGSDAPEKIAAQLIRAGTYRLGDVVILARGGGSVEDLMAFNDEAVVRATAACPLPVISGVGHEIDVTLADLAADVRAATPSAAAELVSDRSEDLLLRVRGFRREAVGILAARVDGSGRTLKASGRTELLRTITGKLDTALRRSDDAASQLVGAISSKLADYRKRLDLAERLLREVSPRALLERGYARVSLEGRSVTDASELKSGDVVTMKFAKGRAEAEVRQVLEEESNG